MDKEEVSQLVGPAGQDEAVGVAGSVVALTSQDFCTLVRNSTFSLC